jgi:hypothetical protein
MKKLLLLPITLPLAMARGAVEGALHVAAETLHDLASGGDGAQASVVTPVTPPPARAAERDRDSGGVADLDLGAAPPRRRPAARPPREVAEDLGLQEGHVGGDEAELVETEGAAAPGPEIDVDEPWPGYGSMRAADIVDRVRVADEATKAVVRLYEQRHGKRRTVLAATER